MNSISMNKSKMRLESSGSWFDRLAKKAVLAMLKKLQVGHLTLEDNGQTYQFGESLGTARYVAHIQITHTSTYKDIFLNSSIGAGESYMKGGWTSPDIVAVIRLMVANLDLINKMDAKRPIWQRLGTKLLHKMNANSKQGSKANISAHYDLGNDFFSLFLDPTMMYSAAMYPNQEASLEQASVNKLEQICRKLQLSEQDHLLEIGTGWGGMAIYAAKHYGCKVTTTTISQEQYDYAKQQVEREGLSDKITLLLEDYRGLKGQDDKLVSIEMIEAVGQEFYDSYFSQCSALLKPHGGSKI